MCSISLPSSSVDVSSSLTSWQCGVKHSSVGSVCLRIAMSRACRPPSAEDVSRARNASLRAASLAKNSSDSPIMSSRCSSSSPCSSSTPVARALARWCARRATVKCCRRPCTCFLSVSQDKLWEEFRLPAIAAYVAPLSPYRFACGVWSLASRKRQMSKSSVHLRLRPLPKSPPCAPRGGVAPATLPVPSILRWRATATAGERRRATATERGRPRWEAEGEGAEHRW
jgi:hypothetical protein